MNKERTLGEWRKVVDQLRANEDDSEVEARRRAKRNKQQAQIDQRGVNDFFKQFVYGKSSQKRSKSTRTQYFK